MTQRVGVGAVKGGRPLYRRVLGAAPLELDTDGGRVSLAPGDALRADQLQRVGAADRKRLDGAVKAQDLEQEGYDVAGDPIVAYARRSASARGALARPAPPPLEEQAPTVAIVATSPQRAQEAARTAGVEGCVALALCSMTGPTVAQAVDVAQEETQRKGGAGCRWVVWVPDGAEIGAGWLRRLWAEGEGHHAEAARDLPLAGPKYIDTAIRPGGNALVVAFEQAAPFFAGYEANLDRDWIACVKAPGATIAELVAHCVIAHARAGLPVRPLGPDLLPLAGASYSAYPRVADGASAEDVAFALASTPHRAVACTADDLAAAAVVAAPARVVAAALAAGAPETWAGFCRALHDAAGGAHVALDAYAWCPQRDVWAAKAAAPPSPPAQDWARLLAPARARVESLRPASLPVQFWTVDLSAFGGVAVILRIVEELQRLGFAAQVGHVSRHQHTFEPPFGPVRFGHRDTVGAEWGTRARWEDGILVATHWWSANTTRQVVERHPGVVEASFWQDREDWFEHKSSGLPVLKRSEFERYLTIRDGVAVSRWITESAAADLGCDTSGIRTIGVGIDLEVFRPGARDDGHARPVRILGMWRPATLRRGHRRLAGVFAELKRTFGDRISLELYGQSEDVPSCVDLHHGWLAADAVARLMGEVDVVVEPSDYQGFGMAGLEALACGAAFVSTACRGVDEYARHEDNALVVPHDGLAAAVARVVEDGDLRRRLQAAGPASVARFGWPSIAREWARFMLDLWRAKGRAGVYDEAVAHIEQRMEVAP